MQVVALSALGEKLDDATLARLRAHKPGTLVNETIWAIIALRAAGERPPQALVHGLLAAQAKGGGFSWSRNGLPDSNDTAAAIEALKAAGGAPVRRTPGAHGARFVPEQGRRLRADEGPRVGRAIDGLGIQALISAGQRPGKSPFRYLSRLRHADGSYRYSVRYATTPVWVTSQVLPALAGKPFPLR